MRGTLTRLILVAVGGCFALAVLPAAASALNYCVSKPSCVSAGGINEGADLQEALDDAALTGVADRVEIGPGTFLSADPGGFVYAGAGPTNSIGIAGVGAAQTKLTGPDSSDVQSVTTLYVQGAQPGNRVSDLQIVVPGASACCQSSRGLVIAGTVERISVTTDPSAINALG